MNKNYLWTQLTFTQAGQINDLPRLSCVDKQFSKFGSFGCLLGLT